MCMFEFPNRSSPAALSKGMEKFECGHCPECLQKKSRLWALRACMESKVSPGMMITLTYDTYKVDKKGKFTNIENPIDPTIKLDKRHCQLFIKRLRKKFSDKKIKYILTAERGKKGRAHYHALIFGLVFSDLIRYKISDRGNVIYKSKTLTDLWSHGICTVDCINLSAKTARYCTKYCSKDNGAEETFMLFSRGIGDEMLLKEFNGKSYWVDGREYSIPKQIWNKVIEKRYNIKGYSKYVNRISLEKEEKVLFNKLNRFDKRAEKNPSYPLELMRARAFYRSSRRLKSSEGFYLYSQMLREKFRNLRDDDSQYQAYLSYWKAKTDSFNVGRPSVFNRILALPDHKYRSYKNQALIAKIKQRKKIVFVPPRSNCSGFDPFFDKKVYVEKAFAPLSRHYRANDTSVKALDEYLTQRKHFLFAAELRFREKTVKKLEYFENPFSVFNVK